MMNKNDDDDYDLTADPVNGECISENDLSKDAKKCVSPGGRGL